MVKGQCLKAFLPLKTWLASLSRKNLASEAKRSSFLWMESGLSRYWLLLFGSGSVPSSASCPSAPKGSCCPSEMLGLVEMTQFQNEYLLRQMWGTISFLHHPWDKGGKNSQLLHQLSRCKSSKVNCWQQMIPFAAQWDLQADNGKHWAKRTMKEHEFKAQRGTSSRHSKHCLSQANHKTYMHLEAAWVNWVPSITLFS